MQPIHIQGLRSNRPLAAHKQSGAAIVESVIALPMLLALILGGVQWGMIFEAKATLNHAALQAARAGAVNNADPNAIRRGLARGLLPLHSPDTSYGDALRTLGEITADIAANSSVRIMNPTVEAFRDFAVEVNGEREIPSDRMHMRPTALGGQSGLSIQDANLLRVQVRYGYELNVPIVGRFITAATHWANEQRGNADPFEQRLLRQGRLPVIATTTVRMQTPARESNIVLARNELDEQERVAIGGGEPTAPIGGDLPALASRFNDEGSSLNDGFFGFNPFEAREDNSGGNDGGEGGGTGGGEPWPFPIGGGGPGQCNPAVVCCDAPRPRPSPF